VIATSRSALTDDAVLRGAATAGRLAHYRADLADYSDLRRVIDQVRQDYESIDVLFNNAGAMPGSLVFSKQKRELGFELNAVVPYMLTIELLPLLGAGEAPLVLQTSSNSLLLVKRFVPEELERPKSFKKLTGPYGQSKLALTLWTAAVAPEFIATGHPSALSRSRPYKDADQREFGHAGLALADSSSPLPIARTCREEDVRDRDQALGIPSGSFVLNGRRKDIPFADCAEAVLSIVRRAYAQFREMAGAYALRP
jgi:NAD(P)-dependent dehydrogenase (short-subunit alcohol dehydrogenase family)